MKVFILLMLSVSGDSIDVGLDLDVYVKTVNVFETRAACEKQLRKENSKPRNDDARGFTCAEVKVK